MPYHWSAQQVFAINEFINLSPDLDSED